MDTNTLKQTAQALVALEKGILAADESTKTIQKRFDKIGISSNPDTNLTYRKMLFASVGIEQFISGVILYDETIRQSIDGMGVSKFLESKGILPGIKVDKGVVDLVNFPGEKITEGLDRLRDRLIEYKELGAKFAKWRAVITIGDETPTDTCIESNAENLARYAALCQEQGIVPIIEPEVLRDGVYDLQKGKEVTIRTLKKVFERIAAHKVLLEGLILKPNMVTCGEDNLNQAAPEEVARATIDALLQAVPKQVPAVVFLSGGQSPDMVTDNLAAISQIGGPWQLSFSFARALQGEALELWGGKEENIEAAQKAFLERTKKVSQAISARSA
ncbi:MAG: class I fructose-bisphosphate aldolase [Candidatus Daviesbacteria bacterium]|nr:class I fructose-bisphosphate aldolase [Candidatus Daviesbacteria bacterium]